MAIIGKVVALTGVATIIKANGETHQLLLGETVEIGDAIQTPAGVEVELELASGRHIFIGEIQLVTFTEEFSSLFLDRIDSAVSDATIETVIQAIQTGKDINEVNAFMKQFEQMKQMMGMMNKMKGGGMMPGMMPGRRM